MVPQYQVNSKIDAILENTKVLEDTVPEFGTIVMVVLVMAMIGIIAVTKKTGLATISRV